jgi:cytosine/adenosine deaminase-related metal-dependent hydrolase
MRCLQLADAFPPDTQFWTAQWVLPVSADPIEQGFVAALDGKILGVGKIEDLPEGLDIPAHAPGSLLTPGLINTHLHLEQSYPNVVHKVPGEPFGDWLLAVVRQNRQHDGAAEKLQRVLAGCEELLSTGTTCVNDVASGIEALRGLDERGFRGFVSLEFFHPASEELQVEAIIQRYEALHSCYAEHSRLHLGLSPHSPYNVSPPSWKALAEACKPPLIHAHAAESEDEMAFFQGKPSGIHDVHQKLLGKTFQPMAPAQSPIQFLARFDLLNNRTILAHVVHTSAEDRKRLADFGVSVAHCPRSNLFLQGGTLHFPDWQDCGVVMGLGTDGRVSTENLDLREEARCAMRLHGWSAREALRVMTLGGASALRLDNLIGSLESGKRADIVLWQAAPASRLSPEVALMAPETRVQSVWIDGQHCWEASKTTSCEPSFV